MEWRAFGNTSEVFSFFFSFSFIFIFLSVPTMTPSLGIMVKGGGKEGVEQTGLSTELRLS